MQLNEFQRKGFVRSTYWLQRAINLYFEDWPNNQDALCKEAMSQREAFAAFMGRCRDVQEAWELSHKAMMGFGLSLMLEMANQLVAPMTEVVRVTLWDEGAND